MRVAHRRDSLCAVADDRRYRYHDGMKTNPFLLHRSDTAPHRDERRPAGLTETCAIKKKALERWENEGGKIPELHSGRGPDAFARSRRF